MFPTTIAGSLPKPAWLAEPNKLWAPWRLGGAELEAAKLDATMLAIKLQEDAGIDVVTDGEKSRQHFVHGFLENVAGIDFAPRSRSVSAIIATRPWCRLSPGRCDSGSRTRTGGVHPAPTRHAN
jgi:methionine synthase II (cobalamin-independent)